MSLRIGSGSGSAGAPGANGTDGKTVRYGAGAPSNALGVDGDFYINTSTNFIYGPKAAGAWPAGVSLVGPQGIQGTQGTQGPAGNNGVTITVGTSAPSTPSVGDLWVDTN
jgi:hypothetical protein